MSFKGDQSKVLIAPVGDPSGWVKATYQCKNYEESAMKSGYFSFVCENGHSEIILVVQDSIVFPTSISRDRNELYNNCKEHTPCYSGARIDTYEQLVEMAERYANCVFSEYKDKLKVIIVPSIGFFKDKCSDEKSVEMHSNAHPDIIRSLLTIKIYEELSRINSPSLTLDVDLTHGVNYLNQLVSQAVRDAASVLSLSRQQVKLNFYSAVPTVERNQYLYLKVISSVEPALTIYDDNLSYPLNAIKYSLENNAPLLLLIYLQKCDISEMEEKLKVFNNSVELAFNEGVYQINYMMGQLPSHLKKFPNSYYYIVFKELLKFKETPRADLYFSVNQIKEFSEKIFKFSRVSDIIINPEINRIEQAAKSIEEGSEVDLSKLYISKDEKDKNFKAEYKSSSEDRNFFAHAGFEMNYTRVKKMGQEILVTYNESINEFLYNRGLPQLNCKKENEH